MNDIVTLPIGWILACIGSLATVISVLAGVIYSSLNNRLAAQDKIIEKLQEDISRMAKGCGIKECMWKSHQ